MRVVCERLRESWETSFLVEGGHQRGARFQNGVSSTRMAARPTATEILALIQRRFGNGGTIFLLYETERLELNRWIWYDKQYKIRYII